MDDKLNYIDQLFQESLSDSQVPVSAKELSKIKRSLAFKRFWRFNFKSFNIYYSSLIFFVSFSVFYYCFNSGTTSSDFKHSDNNRVKGVQHSEKDSNLCEKKKIILHIPDIKKTEKINSGQANNISNCTCPGTVISSVKIDDKNGGFKGKLHVGDLFGFAVASIGDINGDGISDIAVGAPWDSSDGGIQKGAIWIIFLNKNGTVKHQQKISSNIGGFNAVIDNYDVFGSCIASLGDLNKDGTPDIVVQAYGDDDGNNGSGALWVLFLNQDGTVKNHQKISSIEGNLNIQLLPRSIFGLGLDNIGDFDGDGVIDLVAGIPGLDDPKNKIRFEGSALILFMNQDGTVKSHLTINNKTEGFKDKITAGDLFGHTISNIGDINKDGVTDIAIGAPWDNCGGKRRGAEWVLLLNRNGTVKEYKKLCFKSKALNPYLEDYDVFGSRSCSAGDIDGDGTNDLFIGAYGDDDGKNHAGAIYLSCLLPDGKLKSIYKISATHGNFNEVLKPNDMFGRGMANLGDFDHDGNTEIVCGAPGFDDIFAKSEVTGSIWIMKICTNPSEHLSQSTQTK